ncbi:uncharacterized protein LAESUDRAFT_717712 [Laetiporus sulphureus 93-53]|uniref:Fungal-type protein kinase domain-containing protein n=1 Tax=Laetiporus sulphureus 93-53 TaxID=1314785 RepID=A0A165BHZ8_9APHY|nr:uncharacterized protein LAESUDRAFT_717712 [Laetiporus sulphureus 93-53]KZT01096.1 hypothetical protein LAESUDRAFT_717712 [Laetiporus sulphureus 93-53]
MVDKLTLELEHELGGWMSVENKVEVETILWCWLEKGLTQLEQTALHQRVNTFMNRSCKNGWMVLDRQFARESELYAPFIGVIETVRCHFSKALPGKLRECAQNVHDVHLGHESSPLHTSLDIMVLDDRCPTCCDVSIPRYCHSRTAVNIKLDCAIRTECHGLQMGIYAHQMLIEQHDHHFVISFIMTENRIRIYGFDKSGGWYTDLINFSDRGNYHILILAILMLFWSDKSLSWDPDIVLRPVPGHDLGATIQLQNFLVPPRNDVDIDFWNTRLRESTFEMTVTHWTHYWHAAGRSLEAEMLLHALDVNGVRQIAAYREGERISDTRGSELLVEHHLFPITIINDKGDGPISTYSSDRIWCQILLKQYNGPLSTQELAIAARGPTQDPQPVPISQIAPFKEWDFSMDPVNCGHNKMTLLRYRGGETLSYMQDVWNEVSERMAGFFAPRLDNVAQARLKKIPIPQLKVQARLNQARRDYDRFMAILDDAINKLKNP